MRTKSIRAPREDQMFYWATGIILVLLSLTIVYPLIYIISASFSSAHAIITGKVVFFPVEVSLDGYKSVFTYKGIMRSYWNSFVYTIVGTSINVVVTMLAAYPLSRPNLPYRNGIMFLFSFTMLFSGGMIPSYLLLKDLHMLNTIWAMVIPGALSVYNMIITRTFIQSNIPEELREAAEIDGCSDTRYFFAIVLPLSKAVLAVITLYYVVGHWNSYFNAFLYLSNRDLYPLQILLREILVMNDVAYEQITDPELLLARQNLAEQLKYALIIVSSLPVLIMYPFVQKFFVKGVMIGSLKG